MIRRLAFGLAAASLALSPLAARAGEKAPKKDKKPAKKPAAPKCTWGKWRKATSGQSVRECFAGKTLVEIDYKPVIIETKGGGV